MFKCHICGKECKTQFALEGHYRLGDDQHHAYYLSTKERMMALPVQQQENNDFLPSDLNYQPYQQKPNQQQPIQQQRPPTTLEVMQEQIAIEEIGMRLEDIQNRKNKAWLERMKSYEKKPNVEPQQKQATNSEVEQLKQEVIKLTEIVKKQNATGEKEPQNHSSLYEKTPKKDVETEPIPGSLEWIRRENDMQTQIDLNRANKYLAENEQNKIKELEKQYEEKEIKLMAEMLQYQDELEDQEQDEDPDEDEDDGTND